MAPGETWEYGMGYHDVQIEATTVSADRKCAMCFSPGKARRFLNTTVVLFATDGQTRLFVIDWAPIINGWRSQAPAITGFPGGENPAAEKGLLIGSMVLGGLVTAIAASGPVGALPAGALLIAGSLLLMAFGTELRQQSPPTLDQIEVAVERIVTKVVRDELDKQNALKAAARGAP